MSLVSDEGGLAFTPEELDTPMSPASGLSDPSPSDPLRQIRHQEYLLF